MFASKPCRLCRHTKPDGRRCQSPAVKPSAFCFHHRNQRQTRIASRPIVERTAIDRAMVLVATAAREGRLPQHDMRPMLRALQIAQSYLKPQ